LVTSDGEVIGVVVYAKDDRRPGGHHPARPREPPGGRRNQADALGDGSEFGLLKVEPAAL
jgi:hypothetical protein